MNINSKTAGPAFGFRPFRKTVSPLGRLAKALTEFADIFGKARQMQVRLEAGAAADSAYKDVYGTRQNRG